MVAQRVLPFKLESTQETLTSHAGLVLFGEYLHALRLPGWVEQALPAPGSGVGYSPQCYVTALLLMLHGGGRSLEDLRELRADAGLRELLKLEGVPSSDAVGNWLRRTGSGKGFDGLARVQRRLLRKLLKKQSNTAHTLDLDATQIVAEKRSAQWTYKGEKGYMPMVGHLAESGLIVGEAFREGNVSPAADNLGFIKYCEAQLPRGHRIEAVRADSAAYQAGILNYCEKSGKVFAIGGALDSSVKAAIAQIPEDAWQTWRDGELAETVHSMNETAHAFRLIVLRRPRQGDLFASHQTGYRYTLVVSNRQESAQKTMAWYCQRGEASENRIKELKLGFGMERMPCGQFKANAVFFRIGALAYNLFVGFKQWTLGKEWRRYQVQTVRWRLYQSAGKITRHAGQLYLKVSEGTVKLFESIRLRCWEVATAGST